MAENVNIQVIYAWPGERDLLNLSLPAGSTLQQAVEASGLLTKHGLSAETSKFGIYGKQAKPDVVLRERDRVEIYRPLIADPKEMRKARVAAKKARTAPKSGA
ncbi:MAG TPA: RnfH family protein [Rhodocyclaceae bacterium]|nr:RnfH family protein [Rhodocyclaceae bacterium]